MMRHLVLLYFFITALSLHAMKNNTLSLQQLSLFVPYHKAKDFGGTIKLSQSQVVHKDEKTGEEIFRKNALVFIRDLETYLPYDVVNYIDQLVGNEQLIELAKKTYINSYAWWKTLHNFHYSQTQNYKKVHPFKDYLIVPDAANRPANYNINTEQLLPYCTNPNTILCRNPMGRSDRFVIDAHNKLLFIARTNYRAGNSCIEYMKLDEEKISTIKTMPFAAEWKLFYVDGTRNRLYYKMKQGVHNWSDCLSYTLDNDNIVTVESLPNDAPCKKFIAQDYEDFQQEAHNKKSNIWYLSKWPFLHCCEIDDGFYTTLWKPSFNDIITLQDTAFTYDSITDSLAVGCGHEVFFFDPQTQERIQVPFVMNDRVYKHMRTKRRKADSVASIKKVDIGECTGTLMFTTYDPYHFILHFILKPQLNYGAMQDAIAQMSLREKVLLSDILRCTTT